MRSTLYMLQREREFAQSMESTYQHVMLVIFHVLTADVLIQLLLV